MQGTQKFHLFIQQLYNIFGHQFNVFTAPLNKQVKEVFNIPQIKL